MVELKLLEPEERGNLFRAYYSGQAVDITKISFEEFLCQAQAELTAREKDKEWIEFLEGCTFASLPDRESCYLVPHSKIDQLRKQIEGS